MVQCVARLLRKKYIDQATIAKSPLARCLTCLDVAFLGIGSTLAAGVYVVLGEVAKHEAGPAVLISFIIAGIAASLSALNYSEFGARIPRAGSAYIYTYVTMGEFWAFFIGWNLILDYLISAATMARGFSSVLDELTGNRISAVFSSNMPLSAAGIAPYPDWIAFFVVIIVTGVLVIGVKQAALLNMLCTCTNLVILLYACICALFQTDRRNWTVTTSEIPLNSDGQNVYGDGGFAPYGVAGIFQGASTCFFFLVRFDVLATAGEEINNPQRDIPLGIMLTTGVSLLINCLISVLLTLMVPYYQLPETNALALSFDLVGWHIAKYIVLVGTLFSLLAGLLGSLFATPRIIYAMASDGLLFKPFSYVNDRLQTPIFSTILIGTLAALLALFVDFSSLVNMVGIGFLLAYTFVAICVLILRYEHEQEVVVDIRYDSMCTYFRRNPFLIVWWPFEDKPSPTSSVIVKCLVFLLVSVCVSLSALLTYSDTYLTSWWSITLMVLFALCIIGILVLIGRQPLSSISLEFQVPFPAVPLVPVVSIFFNIYLMFQLASLTWLRLAAWMLLGFIIYFLYGMWFSVEEDRLKKRFESAQDHVQFDPIPIEPLGRRLSLTSSEFSLGDDRGRGSLVLTHRQPLTERSKLVIEQ